MMNPDGSEQVNLTQHRADDLQAVWSPTGDQILFVSDRQGTRVRDLYVMDPDGSNVRRVFKRKAKGWRSDPTWSADGKHFAYKYTDWDSFEFGLYLGMFGEADAELFSSGSSPAWSPDGSEIACAVGHDKGNHLIFINVRTGKREQPLPDKALLWQFDPSWSAAGDRLAISGNRHPLPVILDRDLHNAWKTNRQFSSSTGMARGCVNLSRKPVPLQSILCYRQTDRNCFIHRRLTGGSKFSS